MKNFETKYGYFDNNGKEYVIKTPVTPKPWVNVISNGRYGTVISQSGGGFSWLDHSEFNRITRWHQDLIKDDWGKYIYIKNNDTGEIWSPTWAPVKTKLDKYECRFGTGYAKFKTEYKGIIVELILFVPFNDTLEIWDLKIENKTKTEVNLSLFTYFEWVLGSSADFHREFHKQFLETEYDEEINGLLAKKRLWDIPLGNRGHWNVEYEYTGFFSCSKKLSAFEGDKENFIGKYGNLQEPQAVINGKLKGSTGVFNDSIASLLVNLKIASNETEKLDFYLGLKKNREEIKTTIKKFYKPKVINDALDDVTKKWTDILGTLEISTPDKAMNYIINTWSRYQTISGRLWGRTGYYQQSGAYGFRDQLQDSLVFLHINPEHTRNQIKLHARHQYTTGEVLHWWHPISETGLLTKMTDDLLWLPFVAYQYLLETGDYEFLKEKEVFYNDKEKNASIFEHCSLAIEKVLSRCSERGIPIIGEGDWNDGMSAVGLEMKGESFWLAEFFYKILVDFSGLCKRLGKEDCYLKYKKHANKLKESFNKYSWDGEWFIRATKDSGDKIGSAESKEGQIYLNPQTWSVISEISDSEKTNIAMNSVADKLLGKNGCLLLQPAYSKPDKYIGYLTRYAAGRRENGGVYSHASVWAIWAFAKLNRNQKANEVCKKMNPIYSGLQPDEYVAEPFVMPGNVDGPDSPNYGMAGWTWYTGSASWYQKIIVDWILGIRTTEEGLIIDPHIPTDWDSYFVKRNYRGTAFNITVNNPDKLSSGKMELIINEEKKVGNIISESYSSEVTVIATIKSYS